MTDEELKAIEAEIESEEIYIASIMAEEERDSAEAGGWTSRFHSGALQERTAKTKQLVAEVRRLQSLMRGQTFVSSPDWLSPWISVEERFPTPAEDAGEFEDAAVLITGHDKEYPELIDIAILCKESGWYLDTNAAKTAAPTHWMPLPAPPIRRES